MDALSFLDARFPGEEPLTFVGLLHRIYPLPRDTVSLEDFRRRRHQDLADLSDAALQGEADRCRLRCWLEEAPEARGWLTERRAHAINELRQREIARDADDDPRRPVAVFGPGQPEATADPLPPGQPNQPDRAAEWDLAHQEMGA